MTTTNYSVSFERKFKNYDGYTNFYNALLDVDIQNMFKILHQYRLPNYFYKASSSNMYSYSWLRDNFFCSLPELWNDPDSYIKTYQTWLDYYKQVEEKYSKFSSLIKKGYIEHDWEFPNPRINQDLSEIHTGWNHVQTDTIGYFLYGIATGECNGLEIIRDETDVEIINKVIEMLDATNYVSISCSGSWEEGRECPRSSSIGVILAGLKVMSECERMKIEVPEHLISDGIKALNSTLPNETPTRQYDLAQLFLIYPFDILSKSMTKTVLKNIEENLVGENGVYRYLGDKYYSNGKEAMWVFGFCYLGLIYCQLGNKEKARYYYEKVISDSIGYEIPELYYNGTKNPNDNSPLSWSVALTIQLANELKK